MDPKYKVNSIIYVKKVKPSEEFTIKLRLKVSEEATNEIEGITKNLGISFSIKNDKGNVINPKTGDNFRLYFYITIMVISILGIIVLSIKKRA